MNIILRCTNSHLIAAQAFGNEDSESEGTWLLNVIFCKSAHPGSKLHNKLSKRQAVIGRTNYVMLIPDVRFWFVLYKTWHYFRGPYGL